MFLPWQIFPSPSLTVDYADELIPLFVLCDEALGLNRNTDILKFVLVEQVPCERSLAFDVQ